MKDSIPSQLRNQRSMPGDLRTTAIEYSRIETGNKREIARPGTEFRPQAAGRGKTRLSREYSTCPTMLSSHRLKPGLHTRMRTTAPKYMVIMAAIILAVISVVSARAETPAKPLSLKEARETAIQKHPKITAAELQVLVSKQTVREARSAFLPTINGEVTAVGTPVDRNNTLSAGTLQVSSSYSRQADGLNLNELITDFGRTANILASSKLNSQAQEQGALATRAQVLLAVDAAYFAALQAQSVLEVARQTVATRQVLFDRVDVMAKNNLKSDLDATFAEVSLEDSKLLQASAENDLEAAFASLSNLLGEREPVTYQLKDEPLPAPSVTNDWQLVETALKNRPDVIQLRLERDAANKFAHAEKDLNYPTINAFAAAGVVPIRNEALNPNYAAAGLNLRLPLFDGFLYSAREKEAQLKTRVIEENLRDAENNVIRDVRIAVMNRNYAAKRLDLTAKLLASADKANDLAQQRYQVGASSIVELSQAQLSQTEAKISQARAAFEFQVRNAILNYQIGNPGLPP